MSLLENTPSSDRPGAIPAFLSIDVEPNGFQLASPDPAAWTGYAATLEFSEQLRAKLSACTGTPPRFRWYFRTGTSWRPRAGLLLRKAMLEPLSPQNVAGRRGAPPVTACGLERQPRLGEDLGAKPVLASRAK